MQTTGPDSTHTEYNLTPHTRVWGAEGAPGDKGAQW